MKKFSLILTLVISNICYSQNWTWVKGSSANGQVGVYGTLGVPAMANIPCGRHGCGKWVDLNGNLWLFGGEGPTNTWRNDLWKYNITTNQWTWVRGSATGNIAGVYGTKGTASSANDPGSREFPTCWTDASGNFWMFGGDGYDNGANWGRLGDLWKYDPIANQWTWMSGFTTYNQPGIYGTLGTASSTNSPGGRARCAPWTDGAGNLWMLGGLGYASSFQGYLNDLWKYNIATNQWTWVNGNNVQNQVSIYGTLGAAPSIANLPGGIYFPATWVNAAGDIYLFGGYGYAASNVNPGYLNTMWKYNPTTNGWAWLGGVTVINPTGTYGTQGISASTNFPGGRQSSAYWKDASGNLWLFGGEGFSSVNALGIVNDLFRYNPGINEWTWVKGSNLQNQNGSYGTIGVSAPSNMPGAKEYNTWWKDLTGKFWLFGGEGYDMSSTTTGHMNDLWTYTVPCSADSITAAPGKIICSGTSLTFSAVNGGPSTVWYPSAVSTISISGGSTLSVSSLTTASQTVYSYFAESNYCTMGPRASITITVNPLPTLTVSSNNYTICGGNSATLTVAGANSYTWNTSPSQVTNSLMVTPVNTTTYAATTVDLNGCSNFAQLVETVKPLPTLTTSPTFTVICLGQSFSLTVGGANSYLWNTIPSQTTSNIAVIPIAPTIYVVTGTDLNNCQSSASYTVKVTNCINSIPVNNENVSHLFYPNPSTDFFNLIISEYVSTVHLVIFNELGQKKFEQDVISEQTIIKPHLPKGVYFYQLMINGNKKVSGKLVIE